MGKIKIEKRIEVLGETLARKCPRNHCMNFRNAYLNYKSLIMDRQDLIGYVSPVTLAAIEKAIVRNVAQLYDMYHKCRDVREYAARNEDALTRRLLS